MNKTEIQSRIEKVESELASLKADLAKCDCADGIEQEKCWHALMGPGEYVVTMLPLTKWEIDTGPTARRPAYMPECRQVTAYDVGRIPWLISVPHVEIARELHKLGFRMKVTK